MSYEEYSFSLDELIDNINKPESSIKSELSRLIKKKEILNLRKGFYLTITPRYSSAQKLPIQLYCEKLFRHLVVWNLCQRKIDQIKSINQKTHRTAGDNARIETIKTELCETMSKSSEFSAVALACIEKNRIRMAA